MGREVEKVVKKTHNNDNLRSSYSTSKGTLMTLTGTSKTLSTQITTLTTQLRTLEDKYARVGAFQNEYQELVARRDMLIMQLNSMPVYEKTTGQVETEVEEKTVVNEEDVSS